MTSTGMPCSLHEPTVQAVLDRCYGEAKGERLQLGPLLILDKILHRKPSMEEYIQRSKDMYVPLSPERGKFAYLVARSITATRIVEFGTAFGVSTIYLAAAVKDNGGGIVIGTEMEPGKIIKAQANLKEAGLAEFVEIRQGDARETLKDQQKSIDMVLIDGHKDLYIDIVKLLIPHLRSGAVVLADNVKLPIPIAPPLTAYINFMRDPQNGFTSTMIPFSDGMEYSVKL